MNTSGRISIPKTVHSPAIITISKAYPLIFKTNHSYQVTRIINLRTACNTYFYKPYFRHQRRKKIMRSILILEDNTWTKAEMLFYFDQVIYMYRKFGMTTCYPNKDNPAVYLYDPMKFLKLNFSKQKANLPLH